MFRVAIVGSRNVTDYLFVKEKFFELLRAEGKSPKEVEIVSGGARGVDSLAYRLAKELGLSIKIHFPDWKRFGRKAGLLRNSKIVADADVVLAVYTSESKGTWDTIRKARRKGIRVYAYEYRRRL
jgi:predicted Rossmann fold nucleotide-binding protein DprA/Smf involved in DNA uptake